MTANHHASPSAASAKVRGLFGRIAGSYDFLNHFLSLGQDIIWRERLVSHCLSRSRGIVLDLAAGTMDISMVLQKHFPAATVIGLDFSLPMLVRGQGKTSARTGLAPRPVLADMTVVPLSDGCVDCVSVGFGVRNLPHRDRAYREILRVLRPGGRLVILEFGTSRNRIAKGVYNLYLNRLLPVLGRVVSGDREAYTYLAESIKKFPAPRALSREIIQSGFERVFYYPLCLGVVYIHVAEKSKLPADQDQDKTDYNSGDADLAQSACTQSGNPGQHFGHFLCPDKIGYPFKYQGQPEGA